MDRWISTESEAYRSRKYRCRILCPSRMTTQATGGDQATALGLVNRHSLPVDNSVASIEAPALVATWGRHLRTAPRDTGQPGNRFPHPAVGSHLTAAHISATMTYGLAWQLEGRSLPGRTSLGLIEARLRRRFEPEFAVHSSATHDHAVYRLRQRRCFDLREQGVRVSCPYRSGVRDVRHTLLLRCSCGSACLRPSQTRC